MSFQILHELCDLLNEHSRFSSSNLEAPLEPCNEDSVARSKTHLDPLLTPTLCQSERMSLPKPMVSAAVRVTTAMRVNVGVTTAVELNVAMKVEVNRH